MKKPVIGGIVLLVVIMVYLWWSSPLIVSVSGAGEVKVPATMAEISFQLVESNASPVVAVTNLQGKVDQMRKILTESGVEASDVVVSQPKVVPSAMVVASATGYTATLSMGGKTIKVNNVAQISAMLYEKGAALVAQPTLSVGNQKEYEDQALQAALRDAREKATSLGLKNFKFIRKEAAITQSDAQTSTTVSSQDKTVGMQQAATDSITIAKAVSVTYKMW
jgi:uncharacterized protein YggE